MDIIEAIRRSDKASVKFLLDKFPSLVNFENPNFDTLLNGVCSKSIYCGECYQRIKRRSLRSTPVRGYVCDWPQHRRTLHINDEENSEICCCDTPSGDLCNWMICAECFVTASYGIRAMHQMQSLQQGYTPLIVASTLGDVELVELLLEAGATLEVCDPNGVSPFLAAASAGKVDVLQLLLERGSALDHCDKFGRSALQMAVEIGDAACVQVLLGAGTDVHVTDKGGASLLHAAASVAHVGILQSLLALGLDPNLLEQDQCAPLHWLATDSKAGAVRALLDAGADIDAVDKDGMTPLAYATMRDNLTAVNVLLRAGASMEIRRPMWYNCLFASCLFNAAKITEALLEAGAAMEPDQPSPLRLCAQRNLLATAEVCLRYGVPGAGQALEWACHLGRASMVRVLLQHWTGEEDMIPLCLHMALAQATSKGHAAIVKLLLENGADPTHRFASGVTPLQLCTSKKIRSILQTHLSGGRVEIEAEDEELVLSNRQFLEQALQEGVRPWGRSKIMIVGDGRAGKTALANSIMGEEFAHTESTIGINQMTCDVKFAEVGKEGQWDEYKKPDKELEAMLARIVASRRGGMDDAASETAVDSEEGGSGDEGDHAEGNGQGLQQRSSGRQGLQDDGVGAKRTPRADPVRGVQGEVADMVVVDEDDGEDRAGLAIDDALVMRYLASLGQGDTSKFVISLFDYGGQTVFNVIHHLFLTRYGVYTLVFNMEQLVSSDPAVRENCLSTLSFWLNSIVMHTWSEEAQATAPVFLVGTHKDLVSSPTDHVALSALLEDRFGQSAAWASVQTNSSDGEKGTVADDGVHSAALQDNEGSEYLSDSEHRTPALCFFPVDNRRGRRDTTLASLMRRIEGVIDASEYVHAERPLTWLRTMDKLTSSGKTYLSYEEVVEIAEHCGVIADAVPSLLGFLHEMGILMWHDEPSLRDVVILDAVAYFVSPATLVICKHLATAMDATRHVMEAHKDCSKQHYDAWMRLVHQGIANTEVLGGLLKDCGAHASVVLHLMVKFGLVVPLHKEQSARLKGDAVSVNQPAASLSQLAEYLVPALLPQQCESSVATAFDIGAECAEFPNRCLLVFSCAPALSDRARLRPRDIASSGFLPRGLFERLICKAVDWSRICTPEDCIVTDAIYRDVAELTFGSQRFRITAVPDLNSVEIRFPAGSPARLHRRLCQLVQQILSECMKSLRFFTALVLPGEASTGGDGEDDFALIPLQHIRECGFGSSSVADWLLPEAGPDVYIAHGDSLGEVHRARLLSDCLTSRPVRGSPDREVARRRVVATAAADIPQEHRLAAMMRASVPVLLVSAEVLERLASHSLAHEDSILLRWITELECAATHLPGVRRVLPLYLAVSDGDGAGLDSRTSMELPQETQPRIMVSVSGQSCSVYSFVKELLRHCDSAGGQPRSIAQCVEVVAGACG